MIFRSRKFKLWFGTMAVVFVAYFVYSGLSHTPAMKLQEDYNLSSGIEDFNDASVGTIEQIGIGDVNNALFRNFDNAGNISREFGFQKLLHQQGDRWELAKPFMNMWRSDIKCVVTADSGEVQVETAAGKTTPKDALLRGNVDIHIMPIGDSDISECHLYMDNVVYLAERTEFSTAGPVEFVSDEAYMAGTGMEMVYNEQDQRLEFLKIIKLKTLNIKMLKSETAKKTDENKTVKNKTSKKAAPNAIVPTDIVAAKSPNKKTVKTKKAAKESVIYTCIFKDNVIIDSNNHVVMANVFSISDIVSRSEKKSKKDSSDKINSQSQTVAASSVASGKAVATDKVSEEVIQQSQDDLYETYKITCDGSIVIVPSDHRNIKKLMTFTGDIVTNDEKLKRYGTTGDKNVFAAAKVDYQIGKEIVNLKNARCMGVEVDPAKDLRNERTILADSIRVEISGDEDTQSDAAIGIKHFSADGKMCRLSNIKTIKGKNAGGILLKSPKFDFYAENQLFVASGDGVIKIDNSKISEPTKKVSRFSFEKPSYVAVKDFRLMEYSFDTGKFFVDASSDKRVTIGHFPCVSGLWQKGQEVFVTAKNIRGHLTETKTGKAILATLQATGGVGYRETEFYFEGGRLNLDENKSKVNVYGASGQSCMLNGAKVDQIELDITTGEISVGKISGGVISTRR